MKFKRIDPNELMREIVDEERHNSPAPSTRYVLRRDLQTDMTAWTKISDQISISASPLKSAEFFHGSPIPVQLTQFGREFNPFNVYRFEYGELVFFYSFDNQLFFQEENP